MKVMEREKEHPSDEFEEQGLVLPFMILMIIVGRTYRLLKHARRTEEEQRDRDCRKQTARVFVLGEYLQVSIGLITIRSCVIELG
jgi:hypothetical protein